MGGKNALIDVYDDITKRSSSASASSGGTNNVNMGGKGKMTLRARSWSSAALFGVTSTTTVFINKAIFHVYGFKAPATLVMGQMIFSILLLYFFSIVGVVRIQKITMRNAIRVGPLSAIFLLKLLLDMSALSHINM